MLRGSRVAPGAAAGHSVSVQVRRRRGGRPAGGAPGAGSISPRALAGIRLSRPRYPPRRQGIRRRPRPATGYDGPRPREGCMAAELRRTKALVVWDPAALPGPVRVGRGRLAVSLRGRGPRARPAGDRVRGPGPRRGGGAGRVRRRRRPGAACSVLPPHKEGPLAEECARLVAAAAGCTCVAVAGIHQDGATPPEIAAIVANARAGIKRLAAALAAVPPAQRYCSARLPKPRTP